MSSFRPGVSNPREDLKSLIRYKSVIETEMRLLSPSFKGIKSNMRQHLALVDFAIQDYHEFFKEKKRRYEQQQLFKDI